MCTAPTGSQQCFCGIVELCSQLDGPALVPASSSRFDVVYTSATIYGVYVNVQQRPHLMSVTCQAICTCTTLHFGGGTWEHGYDKIRQW